MTVRADAEKLFAIAADCWGFLESESVGAWELRAGGGFTNRANSVWPLGPAPLPLPRTLAAVRAWYAERGLPPQVLTMIGDDLDTELAGLGCRAHDAAVLQIAAVGPAIEALVARAHPNVPVSTAERPQDRWLRLYRAGTVPAEAKTILGSGPRLCYATIYDEHSGEPLSIGRAVLAGETKSWVGLAGIETAPEARRRGLARLVLRTLLQWAAQHGAEHALLEVTSHNDGAMALYRELGFATAYEYHYRTLPT